MERRVCKISALPRAAFNGRKGIFSRKRECISNLRRIGPRVYTRMFCHMQFVPYDMITTCNENRQGSHKHIIVTFLWYRSRDNLCVCLFSLRMRGPRLPPPPLSRKLYFPELLLLHEYLLLRISASFAAFDHSNYRSRERERERDSATPLRPVETCVRNRALTHKCYREQKRLDLLYKFVVWRVHVVVCAASSRLLSARTSSKTKWPIDGFDLKRREPRDTSRRAIYRCFFFNFFIEVFEARHNRERWRRACT